MLERFVLCSWIAWPNSLATSIDASLWCVNKHVVIGSTNNQVSWAAPDGALHPQSLRRRRKCLGVGGTQTQIRGIDKQHYESVSGLICPMRFARARPAGSSRTNCQSASMAASIPARSPHAETRALNCCSTSMTCA